jgi:hypothetical protein
MHTALSSYSLEGIEAVPIDVVVDGDRVRVVDPETRRVLHLVRLEATESVSSVIEHAVNARTAPLRKRAPDKLRSENSTYYSYIDYIIHLTIDNQTR